MWVHPAMPDLLDEHSQLCADSARNLEHHLLVCFENLSLERHTRHRAQHISVILRGGAGETKTWILKSWKHCTFFVVEFLCRKNKHFFLSKWCLCYSPETWLITLNTGGDSIFMWDWHTVIPCGEIACNATIKDGLAKVFLFLQGKIYLLIPE